MFVALKDGHMLEQNYTVLTSILKQPYASQQDEDFVQMLVDIALYSLLLYFIIPLILHIIFKVYIEQFFSLFHVLQIVGNI